MFLVSVYKVPKSYALTLQPKAKRSVSREEYLQCGLAQPKSNIQNDLTDSNF